MKGKLIIFSAPSGSGKTTLVHHLLKTIPGLEFSISATSRKKRPDEEDGKDYFFLSPQTFREKIKNNEFIEWEEVYENQYYGTLRSEVDRILVKGKNVIFDLDVKGGVNMKRQYGNNALAVFVQAPSLEELEKRLKLRSTEDEASFRKRISKAKEEMLYADQFDVIIVNDELSDTLKRAEEVVIQFLHQQQP
jgi:guanylate kinase